MNQNILVILYIVWFSFHFSVINLFRQWFKTLEGQKFRNLKVPPAMWMGWKLSIVSGLVGFAVLLRIHIMNLYFPPISIWLFILLTLIFKEGGLMIIQGNDEVEKSNDVMIFRIFLFVISLLILITIVIQLVEG